MHLLERQNCKVMFKNMTVLSEESELQGLFLNKSSVVACDIKKNEKQTNKQKQMKKTEVQASISKIY